MLLRALRVSRFYFISALRLIKILFVLISSQFSYMAACIICDPISHCILFLVASSRLMEIRVLTDTEDG